MADLFSSLLRLEDVCLPGANVRYLSDLGLSPSPDHYLRLLIDETPWRQETIKVWGKSYQQPRLIAWYGDVGKAYAYSGIRLTADPWTPVLLHIKTLIEEKCQATFNSVLLNYYRDGNDSMGMHSDDEPELGDRPTIASVSLGASRYLIFKSKADRSARSTKLLLESGSLLLMAGDTQRLYKHGISKERTLTAPRVNLTFRRIYA